MGCLCRWASGTFPRREPASRSQGEVGGCHGILESWKESEARLGVQCVSSRQPLLPGRRLLSGSVCTTAHLPFPSTRVPPDSGATTSPFSRQLSDQYLSEHLHYSNSKALPVHTHLPHIFLSPFQGTGSPLQGFPASGPLRLHSLTRNIFS